jgi:hypothetical protein
VLSDQAVDLHICMSIIRKENSARKVIDVRCICQETL